MKGLVTVVCLSLLAISTPQKVNAADDHIRVRLGLSTVSGLAGLEYQKDKIAVDLGWFTPLDAGDESKTRLVLGARYFLSPSR